MGDCDIVRLEGEVESNRGERAMLVVGERAMGAGEVGFMIC